MRVRLVHFDRDRGSWAWPAIKRFGGRLKRVKVRRTGLGEGAGVAALRVSLSAWVSEDDAAAAADYELDVHIMADKPSVRWLRWEAQLTELSNAYEAGLRAIREYGGCHTIHVFYAGPGAGAVCLGRAYHASMNPGMVVHEYSAGARRRYQGVMVVNGGRQETGVRR